MAASAPPQPPPYNPSYPQDQGHGYVHGGAYSSGPYTQPPPPPAGGYQPPAPPGGYTNAQQETTQVQHVQMLSTAANGSDKTVWPFVLIGVLLGFLFSLFAFLVNLCMFHGFPRKRQAYNIGATIGAIISLVMYIFVGRRLHILYRS